MKRDTLLGVFHELAGYSSKYKVMSGDELALRIRECVSSRSDLEREELERVLDGNLEDLIFRSITTREDKISVFSPDMHTKVNYQGEIFYCLPTHRYLSEELDDAFLRWTTMRTPLSTLKNVVGMFLGSAGYQILTQKQTLSVKVGNREYEYLGLSAEKENKKPLHVFIFSSIKFVPHFIPISAASEAKGTVVIVVPTEKTPAPFISFFREHDIGDTQIWVADVNKRTIDPFMGFAEDEEIEVNFANPEKARSAVSMWMKKMPFLDL